MESNAQKNAFIQYEADSWFERNKDYLANYKPETDKVIDLIKKYELKPSSVLEIGCSGGYRLNGVHTTFSNCKAHGIEPSQKAIDFGKKKFPNIHFTQGTADNLSMYADNSMDIVIVGFVFYVIDRQIIFKVISEIDRVLKNGGQLIIIDFFSEAALKTQYEYIKDFSAYSFKQNYDEIFTASKLYYLLDKSTIDHTSKEYNASNDYYNKYSISMLKKDIIASYK